MAGRTGFQRSPKISSGAKPKPVVDYGDDIWETMLYFNLTVPYLFSKKVLPSMIARKYGRIIMTVSVNSKIGLAHGAAYGASKHGLLGGDAFVGNGDSEARG